MVPVTAAMYQSVIKFFTFYFSNNETRNMLLDSYSAFHLEKRRVSSDHLQ